jgi:hypothetical protein
MVLLFFRFTFYEPDREELVMVAYEFYCLDETGKEHLIGILPERRTNPDRMTKDSVLNWGWRIIGDNSGVNNICFVKVEMD